MIIMQASRNVERNVEKYVKMLRLQDKLKDLKVPTRHKEKGFRTPAVWFWKTCSNIVILSPRGNGAITSSEGAKVG